MSIIGHTQVLHFFDRAIAAGKIAQAYVFVGPARVGKKTVAEWVARQLVAHPSPQPSPERGEGAGSSPHPASHSTEHASASLRLSGTDNSAGRPNPLLRGEGDRTVHPDIVHVKREVDEKTGKIKRDIGIPQVRQLIGFMSMASFHGGRKVAIIEEAETLSLEAANALLKTLEEPTASSVLILIAEHLERLPETVVSRCQVLRFRPVPTAIIAEGLRARGVEAGLADECARDAGGRPGVAIEWTENPETRAEWQAGRAQFEKLVSASLAERFKFAEKVSKSAEAREAVGELLERWMETGRDQLVRSAADRPSPPPSPSSGGEGEKSATVRVLSANVCVKMIDRMRQARVMIRENVGVKMAMEYVLLSF